MEIQSWPQTNSQSSRTSSSSSSSSSTSSPSTITHKQISSRSSSSRSNSPGTSFSLKIPSSSHSHRDQESPPPSPQISYLAVQENNSLLYAASLNQITVFDLSNYTLTDTFCCKNQSSGLVKSISFMGNKKILTAHQDGKIRVWQVITIKSNHETTSSKMKHRLVSTLPTLKDRLWRGISSKNYVQIRRHEQKLWIQHADAVSGLAVTEDSLLMYSISWDRSFKTWKLTSSDHTDPCCTESVNNAHSDAINAIVVSPSPCKNNNNNNITVYTASADGSIKVWENSKSEGKKKHKLLTTLDNRHNSRSVNAMVLNKDGSVLFSGGSDSNILAWEITNIYYDPTAADRVPSTTLLSGHKGPILCLIYDGDFLISGSSDRTVRIWKKKKSYSNNNGYCCVAVLEGHTKAVKSLAAIISSTNNYYNNNNNGNIIIMSIFSGSLDGEIKVWQVDVKNFDSEEKEEGKKKSILIN